MSCILCNADCESGSVCPNCQARFGSAAASASVTPAPPNSASHAPHLTQHIMSNQQAFWTTVISICVFVVFGYYKVNSHSHTSGSASALSASASVSSSAANASNDFAENSSPPPATHVYEIHILAAGAPLCYSFNGAITAAAVMRDASMGTPTYVVDDVLSQHGCTTNSQETALNPGASVQYQGGGVVLISMNGMNIFTTQTSITTRDIRCNSSARECVAG